MQPDGENLFASLPDRYPRGWACSTALADTIGAGGRRAYRAPDRPEPTLPEPGELVDALAATGADRVSVLSGIDDRFDRRLVEMLDAAAFHGVVLWLSALSRISRNLDKLLHALEFLIAHNATVLTTNYMIRSSDVWVRRGTFVKPVSNDPRRLPGRHHRPQRHPQEGLRTDSQASRPTPLEDVTHWANQVHSPRRRSRPLCPADTAAVAQSAPGATMDA